jgi:hypothetical protein
MLNEKTMKKTKFNLMVRVGMFIALLVPLNFAFGFSFIDLGLMSGGTQGVATSISQNDLGQDVDLDTSPTTTATTTDEVVITDEETGRDFTVTRREIDESPEQVVNITPQMVDSESALQAFASSTVSADLNIEALSFTDDTVELTYRKQGRLFAFVRMTFNVTAVVQADGSVEVRYPWYRFLVADDNKEGLRQSVETSVSEYFSLDEREGTASFFTPREAAEIAAVLHAAFEAEWQSSSPLTSDENNGPTATTTINGLE